MIKQHITYRLEINVYYSFGSMFSTHLESDTEDNLNIKKAEFIKEQKNKISNGQPSVELITISGVIKKTTEYDTEQNETIQLVDVVTNSYAPLNIQGIKK